MCKPTRTSGSPTLQKKAIGAVLSAPVWRLRFRLVAYGAMSKSLTHRLDFTCTWTLTVLSLYHGRHTREMTYVHVGLDFFISTSLKITPVRPTYHMKATATTNLRKWNRSRTCPILHIEIYDMPSPVSLSRLYGCILSLLIIYSTSALVSKLSPATRSGMSSSSSSSLAPSSPFSFCMLW